MGITVKHMEVQQDCIRQALLFTYQWTGGKDGDINQDILDDLLRLPTRNAHNTQKYKDAMDMIKKSPEVDRLVGHSLASAVINKINEEQPNRFATTTYATPAIKKKRHGKQNRQEDWTTGTNTM